MFKGALSLNTIHVSRPKYPCSTHIKGRDVNDVSMFFKLARFSARGTYKEYVKNASSRATTLGPMLSSVILYYRSTFGTQTIVHNDT